MAATTVPRSAADRTATVATAAGIGLSAGGGVVLVFAGSGLLGLGVLLAVVVFAALVALFYRAPHAALALLTSYLIVQPGLLQIGPSALGAGKEVLLAAATAAVVLHAVGRTTRRGADAWLVSAVALLALLYVLSPAGAHGMAWLHGARLIVEALLVLLAAYLLPGGRRIWRWVSIAVIGAATVAAGYGLLQQAVGPEALLASGYEWGTQVRLTTDGSLRSFGTLGDPFNYAIVLLLALSVIALGDLRLRRWTVAPLMILLGAGLVASFVRTGFVIAGALLVITLLCRHRGRLAAMVVWLCFLAGAGGLVLLASDAGHHAEQQRAELMTLNGRTELWGRALGGPMDVITGRGVGSLGAGAVRARGKSLTSGSEFVAGDHRPSRARPIGFVDSMYLAIIIDVGVLGLLLLVAMLTRLAVLAARAIRAGRGVAWVTVIVLVLLVIDGLTRSSLTSVPSGMLIMLVLGASLAAAESWKQE